MEFILFLLLIALGGAVYFFYTKNKELKFNEAELIDKNKNLSIKISKLEAQASSDYRQISGFLNQQEILGKRLSELEKYQGIVDVVAHIASEKEKCANDISDAKLKWQQEYESNLKSHEAYKRAIVAEAEAFKSQIKEKIKNVELFLDEHSQKTLLNTEQQAKNILGEYYDLAQKTMELNKICNALENKIQGYSDEYLLPNQAILEDLNRTGFVGDFFI
ncbi:hypothetical protein [Acinetobacter sp. YH12025]|uniref:hypothetical protein n=1 Tax=Acinetobacter sp. YH12025 TaxID=2601042 RepID=UPI0015D3A989|nr:hypothetical protein [Acinetobacter sp. YH12025]